MNDEYENEEEQSSLNTLSETIQKTRKMTKPVHRTYNPKVGKVDLPKKNQPYMMNSKNNFIEQTEENNNDIDFSPAGNATASNMISGVYSIGKIFFKHKWLFISICGGSFLFLILMIASAFLLQNASTLNYVSGSVYDNPNYQRLYQEVEIVTANYQSTYGVKIDKHLIISMLTSYQDNKDYKDDNTGLFDALAEYDYKNKISVMVETLAKYQIKTITSCNKDSSSMRNIASNDDSANLLNFWKSELSREKNYDCSGTTSDIVYEVSTDEGNLDDENSGSVFYWNLIDEGFFKEYYPNYFKNLTQDEYEKKAAETLSYIYLYAETLRKYDKTSTSTNNINGTAFWWPIGSNSTTVSDGKLLAADAPVTSTIIANNGALEITSSITHVNVIAVKAGKVVYPVDSSQIGYKDGNPSDGNGYGNYVKIEHSDGTYTLYAHLHENSITVKAGDEVAQGQVIGQMGGSGNTNQQKLRFEILDSSNNLIPAQTKVDINNPRPKNTEFSLTTTSLSKEEFTALMNWYCISTNHKSFCDNFAANAELIYDVSLKNNVNPELVVVTAGTEQGWSKKVCGFNYWSIGVPNESTCSQGPQYKNLEEGIAAYAKTMKSYLEGGERAGLITDRYNQREKAGCDSAGHGLPGTLAGMQSVYSWIGNYRYNPGNWGLGGCVYLNIIYEKNYCSKVPTCKDKNNCPVASKTTVCEQNDYTTYQLQEKIKIRRNIFGL